MRVFDRPTREERAAWPTTAEAAEQVNPYELACRWGGLAWPVPVPASVAARAGAEARDVVDHLQELATMTALARWLDRWTAVAAHRALRSGAGVEATAAAAGLTPTDLVDRWQSWSTGQQQLWESEPAFHPGADAAAEHQQIADALDTYQADQAENADDAPDAGMDCGQGLTGDLFTAADAVEDDTAELTP